MRLRPWALLSLVVLLLAGCAGAPSAEEEIDLPDLGLEATSTTGIVRGVVVDEAIRPLTGATVTLRGPDGRERTATSGEVGAFGFDGLPAGTYFLKARKPGYVEVQQTTEVVAGVAEPPIVKFLLPADAAGLPFHVTLNWDGYVECGTDALAVCAVPDFANQTACDAAGVCPGKVNNDDFDQWFFIEPTPEFIQVEMVWESTQSVSQTFSLLLAAEKATYDTGYYEFGIESVDGASPLMVAADRDDIEDAELGNRTGLITAVFSGAAEGNPLGIGGFVLQQRFSIFVNVFYGYVPPEDWRFVDEGTVPPPA